MRGLNFIGLAAVLLAGVILSGCVAADQKEIPPPAVRMSEVERDADARKVAEDYMATRCRCPESCGRLYGEFCRCIPRPGHREI